MVAITAPSGIIINHPVFPFLPSFLGNSGVITQRKVNMSLQKKIKADLAAAMKAKDEAKKSALRVIMGELGRQAEKKISDADVIGIVKKLVKSEKEVMEKRGTREPTAFMRVAQGYLPQMATEEEIQSWIAANINFDEIKNKMQAMKPIMQHFGSNADGNLVKKVLAGFP
jgi:uncharacterized protein YqeY